DVAIEHDVATAVRHLLQTCGHAVAENRDRGFHEGDLLLQPLPAFVRAVERGARPAARRVAVPREIAHAEFYIGKLLVHARLERAEALFALEERIAEQQHAIAVFY